MFEMKMRKKCGLIILGVMTIRVPCRSMARPTGAETVLSLTDIKGSTQTTLGGVNTIIGAVKFLFDIENLTVWVGNVFGGPYHVFV